MKLQAAPSSAVCGAGNRLSGDLDETPKVYRDDCRHLPGDTTEAWSLVVQMLQTLVQGERERESWRWRPSEVPIGGAAGACDEAKSESWNR